MTDEQAMQAALAEAYDAQQAGEVPVGAVILHLGNLLATGQNRVIRDADPTAHAEIVALRAAGRALANYRLEDCTLITTLEPCAMCAGAILHARIARLLYATPDPKAGACGSALTVLNHPRLNHSLQIEFGLLGPQASALLTGFFRARRHAARKTAPEVPNAAPIPRIQRLEPPALEANAMATKKWSAKVQTDETHPDHGLFLEDAESIAKALATPKVSPKGPASGMRMLNFYINRAGKNLHEDRIKELEKAKTILSAIIADQKSSAKPPAKTANAPAKKAAAKQKSASKSAGKTSAKKSAS